MAGRTWFPIAGLSPSPTCRSAPAALGMDDNSSQNIESQFMDSLLETPDKHDQVETSAVAPPTPPAGGAGDDGDGVLLSQGSMHSDLSAATIPQMAEEISERMALLARASEAAQEAPQAPLQKLPVAVQMPNDTLERKMKRADRKVSSAGTAKRFKRSMSDPVDRTTNADFFAELNVGLEEHRPTRSTRSLKQCHTTDVVSDLMICPKCCYVMSCVDMDVNDFIKMPQMPNCPSCEIPVKYWIW